MISLHVEQFHPYSADTSKALKVRDCGTHYIWIVLAKG